MNRLLGIMRQTCLLLAIAVVAMGAPQRTAAQPSVDGARAALVKFFAAYDDHDLAGVLATLAPDIDQFTDCDWAFRRPSDGVGAVHTQATIRAHLEAWFRARFAEHDRFDHITFQGDDPAVQGVYARRTSDVLATQGLSPHDVNFKIFMHGSNFDRIGYVVSIDYNRCGGGQSDTRPVRFMVGASAVRTRSLVQAFLDAYNAHNITRVLATVRKDVVYKDCNYRSRRPEIVQGKSQMRAWLQARFRENDHFLHPSIMVDNPDQPYVAAIEADRDSQAIRGRQLQSVHMGIKLVLDGPGYDRISYAVSLSPADRCSS